MGDTTLYLNKTRDDSAHSSTLSTDRDARTEFSRSARSDLHLGTRSLALLQPGLEASAGATTPEAESRADEGRVWHSRWSSP